MPEIILMTLAKNLFRILKNEVRNKKNRKGGCTPPINPSPINKPTILGRKNKKYDVLVTSACDPLRMKA